MKYTKVELCNACVAVDDLQNVIYNSIDPTKNNFDKMKSNENIMTLGHPWYWATGPKSSEPCR